MNRKAITSISFCAIVALMTAAKVASRPHEARAGDFKQAGVAPRATPVVAGPTTAPVVKVAVDDRFAELRGREGFWRIARTHDGVWWFLSPKNKTEFLNGVTTVQPALASLEAGGSSYLSSDWDRSPATLSHWAELTVDRVQAVGFKSMGAWCNPVLHNFAVPMTRDLNVCRWVPYDARLFSADWERGARCGDSRTGRAAAG